MRIAQALLVSDASGRLVHGHLADVPLECVAGARTGPRESGRHGPGPRACHQFERPPARATQGGDIATAQTYNPGGPFAVRDCALAAIATGRHAQNLKELRDELNYVDSASIYYHFWGGLLRPTFDDPSYHNDFSRWAHDTLHNSGLAERLSVIDPTNHVDLESLRRSVIDVVEDELDRTSSLAWTPPERRFLFIRSQIVIFGTRLVARTPEELPGVVASMSRSSVFYHFIDARRRTPNGVDDFSTWLLDLQNEEYAELCTELSGIDPFFQSLTETKVSLVDAFARHLRKEVAA